MFLIRLFFWCAARAQAHLDELEQRRAKGVANAPSAKDTLTRAWQAGSMAHGIASYLFRHR